MGHAETSSPATRKSGRFAGHMPVPGAPMRVLLACVAVLLLLAPLQGAKPAEAAVRYSETASALTLEGSTYRLILSPANGGIMDVHDLTDGDRSLLSAHGSGCLWLAVFPSSSGSCSRCRAPRWGG